MQRFVVFFKSLFAGGVSTVVDFGTYFLFAALLGVREGWANFAGIVLGSTVNFIVNRDYAFKAKGGLVTRQVYRYIAVTVVMLGLTTWLFSASIDVLPTWPTWLLKAITGNLVFLAWTFPTMKYFVFRAAGSELNADSREP